jgi:hypothetical protein
MTTPDTLRTLAAWCERYNVAPYGVTMHLNRQVSVDVTAADMAALRRQPGAVYRRSPWSLPGSVFVAQDRVTLDGIEAQYLLTRPELDADRPLLSVPL